MAPKKHHFIRRFLKFIAKTILILLGLLVSVFLIFLAIVTVGSIIYNQTHKNEPYKWGVSFSIKQARDIGIDWRAAYTATLDDLNMKSVRLMSYWDEIEKSPGQYDFSDLDWMFDQAAKRKITVTLAIGLRQPRWPECHPPTWAKEGMDKHDYTALYDFITTTVNRYKTHKNLISYQLENEAMLKAFGGCTDYNLQRIEAELAMVKSLDTKTPVYMSLDGQWGLPWRGPVPDGYAYSLYRRNWVKEIGIYFDYPLLPSWYSGRAEIIRWYTGRPVIIHELQLEPWGPAQPWEISVSEQDITMSPARIHEVMQYARDTQIKEIYTWGSEWWYWRKINGDPNVWNAVKKETVKDK